MLDLLAAFDTVNHKKNTDSPSDLSWAEIQMSFLGNFISLYRNATGTCQWPIILCSCNEAKCSPGFNTWPDAYADFTKTDGDIVYANKVNQMFYASGVPSNTQKTHCVHIDFTIFFFFIYIILIYKHFSYWLDLLDYDLFYSLIFTCFVHIHKII